VEFKQSTKCRRVRSVAVFVPIAAAYSNITGVFAVGAAGWPGYVRRGLLRIGWGKILRGFAGCCSAFGAAVGGGAEVVAADFAHPNRL